MSVIITSGIAADKQRIVAETVAATIAASVVALF